MVENSSYQDLMVSKGNSSITKFTRQPKDFTEFRMLTELRWLTQEIVSIEVFIEQGQPMKDFIVVGNKFYLFNVIFVAN